MYEILFDGLLVLIVGLTVMAVWSRDLLKSVIFLSAASGSTALIFFLLNAPDIAITKAAVEAGVATAVFVVAIQKTSRFEKEGRRQETPSSHERGKKEMITGKPAQSHKEAAK